MILEMDTVSNWAVLTGSRPVLAGHPGVWPATAAEVLAAFTAQQEKTA